MRDTERDGKLRNECALNELVDVHVPVDELADECNGSCSEPAPYDIVGGLQISIS